MSTDADNYFRTQWWGYRHTNGSLQVKRYFDDRDIQEARESDFVVRTAGPFYANNREEALYVLQTYFTRG